MSWEFMPAGGGYAFDDFEAYSAGAISILDKGHGGAGAIWTDAGQIIAAIFNYGAEAFESLTTGTLSSLGAGTNNSASGDTTLDASASFI